MLSGFARKCEEEQSGKNRITSIQRHASRRYKDVNHFGNLEDAEIEERFSK